ncbi:MerR family transcriptional regulator [Loktanella sp. D2R18]|uniref:MerR family transcriptional regulator n=1 Tax=Rhodobacterales TaxID=204455 RepID=UPI000DEBDD1E|nr:MULTISPECIES: MerR family transcriptional regulator [Rhodobacterales]MDO6589649.1 MerR family transcriptional regulator [Yoonia sp. 1_MG-2023]RBW44283.1 MerR family transcriptional regulator [Loktanella sp. D2R18]
MAKAKDAFRTISEVAEWLDTPTHVLRFWESKFTQIKPVKGAGSRRYYRPADMELLGGIKQLLHEDGMTIKGAQKLLREQGVKHVATLGKTLAPAAAPEPVVAEKVAPQAPDVSTAAPATDPTPRQNSLPFEETPVFTIDVAPLPDAFPDLPGRLVGTRLADKAEISGRAAQIAPLLARLEHLRNQMHKQ